MTPGWVDIHTHYDGQITWDAHLTPTPWNGVTTVVMGNCGVGFAPVQSDRHDFLIQLMEGVEDIPGSALTEGIQWQWETFPEYLDVLGAQQFAIDVGSQVPHGAVRAYVMGDAGAKNEEAKPEDIAEMASIVKEGLEAGALGVSTARTHLHRAKDGEFVPGTHASPEEVLGIGRMLGEVGHGVFQLAGDYLPEEAELGWMMQLGRETGKRVLYSMVQSSGDPDQWRRLLRASEVDRAEGGMLTPLMGAPFLSEADFEHYVASFSRTGFRGGINWYRNIDGNAVRHPDVGVVPLDIPCLMLMADRDPGLRPEFAADMPDRCSNLEMHLIEKTGPWVQQEQPEAFNRHLLGWLQRHLPATD